MPTDYLDEIIGAVKQGAKEIKDNEEGQGINAPATPPQPQNTQQTTQPPQEKTQIVQETKKPEDKEEEIAHEIIQKDMKGLEDEDLSAAEKTAIEKELEANKKIEVKAYGKVKIYRIPGKPLAYYFVPTTKPTASERRMINTLKEATTRLISITPYKIRNPEERRVVYKQKIIEIIRNNPNLRIPESRQNFYADAVVREMVGYGLIDDLIKDDNLEEIMIVGPKRPVYVFHREYEMMLTNIEYYSEQEIEDLINKIAREVNRRVDVSSPLLDARLTDGSRVNATIPPASISGGTITIRKFRKDPYSMIDLVRMNTISSEAAAFLWLAVDGMGTKPANVLISGGTGSGKTTLLNVLASFVPDRERVITIEDTAELNLPIKHWIRLESRPPGLEGAGELKMDILTKNSLRMRPDRIIVGEIRHEEAFTLFTALNTGHDGALKGNSVIQFSNGKTNEIEKIFYEQQTEIKNENGFEYRAPDKEIFVPSLNKITLQIENKRILRCWKKKNSERLTKIHLKTGKELTLTNDHPLYKLCNGVTEIPAGEIRIGDYLAIPEINNLETEFEIATKNGTKLKLNAKTQIKFEEVTSIEENEADYVYDFTVEENHNYIANGVIVSNCMGTVHANSPAETLIRLMSPPMSVPSIMLTGLDLIVVEHRYYDRKKGTIRRISEIAEVYGAMEGQPKTQILYQRDSVRDVLEKTLIDSRYLKMLQNFTGAPKDRILAEIDSRKNFLENLVQKNIRDLSNVSESAKKYVIDKNIMV
ncbi:MAG: ATPase, T2SS/T4P/T4SS family [archaeon]